MSRRKKSPVPKQQEPAAFAAAPPPAERWPQPVPRPWQLALSAACVLAWLAFLAYLALRYGT